MKKRFYPLFSFFLFFLLPAILHPPALADPATAGDAEAAVRNWLTLSPSPLGWKAPSAEADELISGSETYVDESENALFHVVYIHPKGLVIVPADDFVEPIIAFLPNAVVFDPSDDTPLGAMVGSDVPGRLNAARETNRSPSVSGIVEAAERKWSLLLGAEKAPEVRGQTGVNDERVAPLVQSRWSQSNVSGDYCYNYYTPNNYPAGCVATAFAQILRFHEHPTAGVGAGTYTIAVDGTNQQRALLGGDGVGGPYEWENMPLTPDGSITEAQRQAIGALTHDAGVSVNMSYKSGGSGASTLKVATRLIDSFGYGSAIKGYHDAGYQNIPSETLNDMINPNLDAGSPVILSISRPGGGHAIVCDGYGYNTSTLYHHLNMGWGGYYDAWYNLPTIDAGSYNYDTVRGCVYNIFISGSGEIISGRATDFDGVPLPGVAISATPGGHTDTTDDAGIYALAGIPSDTTFTISASKRGYAFDPMEQATGTSVSGGYGPPVGNVWAVDFVGVVEEGYWMGDAGAIWNLAGNWSDSNIPDGDTDVRVADAANQPTINSSADCGSLSIESGGTLTIESDVLTIM